MRRPENLHTCRQRRGGTVLDMLGAARKATSVSAAAETQALGCQRPASIPFRGHPHTRPMNFKVKLGREAKTAASAGAEPARNWALDHPVHAWHWGNAKGSGDLEDRSALPDTWDEAAVRWSAR